MFNSGKAGDSPAFLFAFAGSLGRLRHGSRLGGLSARLPVKPGDRPCVLGFEDLLACYVWKLGVCVSYAVAGARNHP